MSRPIARRWTKREIKILTGSLDAFMLNNRPPGVYDPIRDESFRRWLAGMLASHRPAIVEAAIRGRHAAALRLAEVNLSTARHYENNPAICSLRAHDFIEGRPEIVVRFERLAAEEQKSAAWFEKLLARVVADGLPHEVVAHDPLARQ